TATFTNTTGAPVAGVKLSVIPPSTGWRVVAAGGTDPSKSIPDTIEPGASVSATFKITSGPTPFNGDMVATASWANTAGKPERSETATEKVRNVSPVKINEFRISSGPSATNSFIELYNAGSSPVDLSSWTLTERPAQQAIFSAVKIPAGTKLGPHHFYVLGLSNSGLAVPARKGDSTLHVRNTTGMAIGDTISIDTGSKLEKRKIVKLGTAANNHTTLWQPLPDGPVITIPAGSTNVPVESVAGFKVGEKIALGYGATYPFVGRDREQYEVATVTSVGKPGTQAYLAVDAPSGATNIKVTSVDDISVGDKIRLDIDSTGHGIETVTVTKVGKRAPVTNLSADASVGATRIKVRNVADFAVGKKLTIGTPANQETVTISHVGGAGRTGAEMDFTPALARTHIDGERVVSPGTGLDVAAPLRFNHAANMPFSNRGTGISFEPATAFAHSSNEPVQALGSGIVLDRALNDSHAINSVLRDANVTTAGYQGSPDPDQWFGGPELTTYSPLFGRTIPVREGSMVLRDGWGMIVDSLNYGGLVDPWAAEGYQGTSGGGHGGCFVPAPGPTPGFGPPSAVEATNISAGRFPDGVDTDSNCSDFLLQAVVALPIPSAVGATNLKVSGVAGFDAGQSIRIGSGKEFETAVIASVGTGGATTVRSDTSAGATVIPVANAPGFSEGQTIAIGSGTDSETAVIASIRRFGPAASISVIAPLAKAYAAGTEVAGTGITLTAPLRLAHGGGTQVAGSPPPTPGAPNQYSRGRE
ncbi:MAG TPA: lamin tail domain-containing protein, partial [Acidobacteriaceae bacterium]